MRYRSETACVGANRVPIHVSSVDAGVTLDYPSAIIVQVDQVASADVQVTIQRLPQLPVGFHEVSAVVIKNWLPFVFGPALAIASFPGC